MADACTALDFPVVSGNVSLYNETNGRGIPPTPAIGGVGLLPDSSKMATLALKSEGDVLLLIGEEKGWLGQSLYQRELGGGLAGAPPPVDLAAELVAGEFVRGLIRDGHTTTVHDVSDGGLLVAIAEMALAGNLGVAVEAAPPGMLPHAAFFGEDQGRYIIAVAPALEGEILGMAHAAGLSARLVGRVGGALLSLPSEKPLPLTELRAIHESWFPRYMGHAA
jgi:phosphoribosylformylglycinamidine synthase